jgi:hypothetical protein
VKGKNGFHAEGLSLHGIEKETGLVEVCRHDRAKWIHVDTTLPKRRIGLDSTGSSRRIYTDTALMIMR